MNRVGDRVKVRGADYRIEEIVNLSHLGSRYFGKFRFVLSDADGNLFRCSGKRVAHNSSLTPVVRPQESGGADT